MPLAAGGWHPDPAGPPKKPSTMLPKSAFKSMLAGLAIMLHISACNAQAEKKHPPPVADPLARSVDPPHVEVRVNKQYDAQGNLISFDSTHTSIYRGQNGPADLMDPLFQDFKPRFGTGYPFLNDPGFNDLFFNDSLMHQDFFHDNFFRKRMEMNQRYLEQMMTRMDSVKNAYLRGEARKQDPVQ